MRARARQRVELGGVVVTAASPISSFSTLSDFVALLIGASSCVCESDGLWTSCRCGFEFGNDDNPGTEPPVSFDKNRSEWEAENNW